METPKLGDLTDVTAMFDVLQRREVANGARVAKGAQHLRQHLDVIRTQCRVELWVAVVLKAQAPELWKDDEAPRQALCHGHVDNSMGHR